MKAEDVALLQQIGKRHELHTVGGIFRPDGPGADEYPHPECSGNAGRLPPNAAVAVDAEGLAVQLHLGQQAVACRDVQLPQAVLDGAVIPLGTLDDGQQQAEGHLRHTISRIARHVGYCHAMAAAGVQIQIVGAGGDDAHELQVRALGQNGFIHPAFVEEDDLGIPDTGRNLLVGRADVAGGIRDEGLDPRPVEVALVHDIAFQNDGFHRFSSNSTSSRSTCPMGWAMHRSALSSAGVGCMLMTTRCRPRKYRSSPAAG